MKIILVCLKNLQEYIFDNIKNLRLFGNNNITIITEKSFFNKFDKNIELINYKELNDYCFNKSSKLNRKFRNGFWHLTSLRLFYLYSYIKKYNVQNCIHLENDVMLYCNLKEIKKKLINFNKTLIVMDSEKRCVPSFIFIPNWKNFEPIISQYNNKKNDMKNLAKIFHKNKNYFDTLPIFKTDNSSKIKKIITKNFNNFQCIFDGAAIGQYLGGIDPKNSSKHNTCGFVNETCVFDYSKNKIEWIIDSNKLKRPYIYIENEKISIINLHIHCKNLKKFMGNSIYL